MYELWPGDYVWVCQHNGLVCYMLELGGKDEEVGLNGLVQGKVP